MAITNSYISIVHVLFIYLVLFFSCYSNKLCIYGAATGSYHIIETDMLLSKSTCSASTTNLTRQSQALQISHSDGPCSPLGQHQKSPSSGEIFLKDESRVRSMNNAQTLNPYRTDHHHTDKEFEAGVPTSALSIGSGIFTALVGFGTPKRMFGLIFDTGSDITWIQCNPCHANISCPAKKLKNERKPMFDRDKSSSYSSDSCISGIPNSDKIRYADGSQSIIFYGCDTLFLPPSDVLSKFQFGCGLTNNGDFGNADGMLGLGQGQLSLTSQAASKFGKVFSYCLPSLKSSTGYLLFGKRARAKAIASASSLKFTPLVRQSTSFYYVSLIGISVANERLNIDPFVFESPGTVIDSGTVITRLPPTAYSALQIAFKKSMSKYPSAPALLMLNTCYNLSGIKNVAIPKIVLHFGGGTDESVHPSGIFWKENKSLSQVCLAFARTKSSSDLTIIGNQQQLTLQMFHDLEGRRVGFGTNGCS